VSVNSNQAAISAVAQAKSELLNKKIAVVK
jgi:hypothetical protein